MECHKLRMSDLQLYAALDMVGEGAVGVGGGGHTMLLWLLDARREGRNEENKERCQSALVQSAPATKAL